MPTKAKKKKRREPEKYWQEIVSVVFQFYREKLLSCPSFDVDQPRSLRLIVVAMRKRVHHAGLEWNCEMATRMMRVFLEWAYSDPWLHENFLLFNLNRQKDKIFFRIKQHQIQKNKNAG